MPARIVIAAVAVFALAACQTTRPDGSAAAPGVETVRYTSANVQSGLVLSGKKIEFFPVELHGKLWLPEGDGPFPVVVWGHPTTFNSGDLAQWRRDLRRDLAAEGIGIFFADSYTGRGLGRRATSSKLNSTSRYVDGMRALVALAGNPKVDPKRIGISGASFGANVAMRLQWEPFVAQVLPPGLRYAAHVPIYPPCSAIIKDFKSTGAPMLILIGEKDYNDASRCGNRVAERRQAGAQVDLVTYPGAHHGFIASVPPRMVETPVYRDCMPYTIDKANGVFEMKFGSTADMPIKELIGKMRKSGCIEPRGMVGGNSAATKDALQRTVAFFAEHLRK